MPLLSEHGCWPLSATAGFAPSTPFGTSATRNTCVSVSLWRDRGAALAVHQRVLEAMEPLRNVFPTRPTITVGAARVVAAA